MIDTVRKLLPPPVRRPLGRLWYRLFPSPPTPLYTEAYSQEGEDMILLRIFIGKPPGFYVDVGAHHPKRFSNTYLFYQRGWSGINVDAMPGSMDAFRRERPRDCNIEAAVGRDSGVVRKFWIFDEPALNTFDEAIARSAEGGEHHRKIIDTREVPTRTLQEICAAHVPAGTKIDFLSVDVEGLDLEVLQSNDWDRYRPTYVMAECTGVSFAELPKNEVCQFLLAKGYDLFAKTVNTVVFHLRA